MTDLELAEAWRDKFYAAEAEVKNLRATVAAYEDELQRNERWRADLAERLRADAARIEKLRADYTSMKRCHDADALELGRLRKERDWHDNARVETLREVERLTHMVSEERTKRWDWEREVEDLRTNFAEYADLTTFHRSWCNGGYEGSDCSCDRDGRVARILKGGRE